MPSFAWTTSSSVYPRASLVVEGVGAIGAALGDGLEDAIGTYQQAISDLT